MNKMITIAPFDNDHDVLSIGGLTIENGLDSISIYGELEIYPTTDGLLQAQALQDFANALVAKLEGMKNLTNQSNHTNDNANLQVKNEKITNPFA